MLAGLIAGIIAGMLGRDKAGWRSRASIIGEQ
jgi:hypothetical protein